MYKKIQFAKADLVWVPKTALSLYSTPGREDTKKMWNVGIIIKSDKDGNVEVYVNGELEASHHNFLKPMG